MGDAKYITAIYFRFPGNISIKKYIPKQSNTRLGSLNSKLHKKRFFPNKKVNAPPVLLLRASLEGKEKGLAPA